MTLPFEKLVTANDLGVRLEVANGLPIWEAMPSYRHQKHVRRISGSVRPGSASNGCECVTVDDVYVQFPGSLRRPDIAVFCHEPPDSQQDSAITLVPEAIIEVISEGYEAKDLQIAPGFYLGHGVKDVVVFDPKNLMVLHHAQGRVAQRMVSPVEIALACGCVITV